MPRKYNLFERRLKRAVKKTLKLHGPTEETDQVRTTHKKNSKLIHCLMRQQHLKMLSAPKAIRLRVWPDPEKYVALPAPIARGTLTGRVPSRIEYLSQPKVRQSLAQIQAKDARPSKIKKPNEKISYDRIFELSQPKGRRGRVQPPPPPPPPPRSASRGGGKRPAKSRKSDKSASEKRRIAQDAWLLKNSLPKRQMYPRPSAAEPQSTAAQPKISESQRQDLIRRLHDDPVNRKLEKRSAAVKAARPKELKIQPNWVPDKGSRIHALSMPRKLAPEARLDMAFDPYRIPRAVLRAKPSKRVVELSAPRVRHKNTTDIKENAFQVSPAALKYKPTRRIKWLALPIVR